MRHEWGIPEADLLSGRDATAVLQLRASLGFDVLAQPEFWERVIAHRIGGRLTPKNCPHDVEITEAGLHFRAEVKFSRAFSCSFEKGPSNVFKWARILGFGGKASVDATVLVGRDVDGLVYAWVVPNSDLVLCSGGLTVRAPSARTYGRRSRMDDYAVPFDQIIHAFLRAARVTRAARRYA